MGSEDLFRKRKTKTTTKLARRKAKRSAYDKVLIVCEGEKTEPNYFINLIQYYKINTANVEVDGSCGSSPKSIFDHAFSLWNKENKKGDPYDRVYCVFDKDNHSSYDETIKNISRQVPKGIFYSIASVPCFEYWLLLHFTYTTKPYAGKGKLSIGDVVVNDLKKYLPDYEKGSYNIFSHLFNRIDTAKNNAENSLKYAEINYTDNPTTHIHKLVNYLQRLKQP